MYIVYANNFQYEAISFMDALYIANKAKKGIVSQVFRGKKLVYQKWI